ncbi:MAG: MlaD family protein [Myxococcota bacterium]
MSQRKTELRVGIFVVAALLIGGILAFVIGSQRNMFRSKRTYHAVFRDVGGLRPGNGVLIAGVNVGTVNRVAFRDDGKVEVHFRVVEDSAHLIRGNPSAPPDPNEPADTPSPSLVSIGSKGLLGDRQVDISVGDLALPEWPVETPLFANESGGLMAQVENVADEVEGTAENIRLMTDPFRDQAMSNDLKEVAHNLAAITGMLATGDGAVQRLMTDPNTADEVDATLRNLRQTSSELARTSRSFRLIADEIRTGDGTANAIVYGEEGREAIGNISRASGELAQLLGDVRTGDGTVHDLIYEDSADQMVANLTQVSGDLAHITGEIRAGRGTIGGLLVDPSIYEDVKRLVGDLQRNDILRALVRYSIRRDEAAEAATPSESSESSESEEP